LTDFANEAIEITVARVEKIVMNLRGAKVEYAWFVSSIMRQLNAMMYKSKVESGAMKPMELFTPSDEAFGLLALENGMRRWAKEYELKTTGKWEVDKDTLPYTMYTRSGVKNGGWSAEGLRRFNKLYDKVVKDRASNRGKTFEKDFQESHKRAMSGSSRKRKATTSLFEVSVRSDIAFDDSSDKESVAST